LLAFVTIVGYVLDLDTAHTASPPSANADPT
jgi:hypothetical protein